MKHEDRNYEMTVPGDLLLEDGSLAEAGWSRNPLKTYHRKKVRAPGFRMKEWDYYLVMNQEAGAAFTISDNGYIGLQSVSLLNFKEKWEHTETILNAFPMGKLNMPGDSRFGDVVYEDKRLKMSFSIQPGKRILECHFLNFFRKKELNCRITLYQPEMDSMVITIPFQKKKNAFYYNQKINCMRAEGYVEFDDRRYEFHPQTDFGTLDWGRGVWTYHNTWYWGNGNFDIDGHAFGFNIGYGFGDNSRATENVLFYDGKAHKLADVIFHIPEGDYEKPWYFSSGDGRFEMEFQPIIDRAARLNAILIETDQHQVFGRMTGKAILDDGKEIFLKDGLCFAEKVLNRY